MSLGDDKRTGEIIEEMGLMKSRSKPKLKEKFEEIGCDGNGLVVTNVDSFSALSRFENGPNKRILTENLKEEQIRSKNMAPDETDEKEVRDSILVGNS